jgi:hypothetical protein
MNRGWKRGFTQVASLRAAENLNSPTSSFIPRMVAPSVSALQANSWDWIILSNAIGQNVTVNLPMTPAIGDQVKISRNGFGNGVIVAPSPGQTLAGLTTTLTFSAAGLSGTPRRFQQAVFEFMPAATGTVQEIGGGQWVLLSASGADGGVGFIFGGTAAFNNGTNTAQNATVTTPTLGAAAQLAQTTMDSEIYLDVTTAGNLVVAIGPTSGVANTIFSGTSPIQLVTFRLPAAWYVAVTTSNVDRDCYHLLIPCKKRSIC